jgi:uncharacterized protein (TIGR03083 family)
MSPTPAPLGPPLDVRPMLPAERAALRQVLNDLDDADWSRTTTPGWTVFDTVAHLVGSDLARLSRTRDGQQVQSPAAGEDLVELVDRQNEEWVHALQRLSPRVLVELLETFGPRVVATFAGMELTDVGETVSWASDRPAPVWLDIAREYTERWVHQQQIRLAVETALLDEPRFLAPVLDTFLRALPAALSQVARPEGTAVIVNVPGPAGGTWWCRRSERSWGMVPAAPSPEAAVTVDVDAGVLWRVAARMLTPEQALSKSRVEGDRELAGAVLSLQAIIR